MKFNFLKRRTELAMLSSELKLRDDQITNASNFIQAIENSDFRAEIPDLLDNTALGNSLESMKKHLNALAASEQKRNWLNTGLANFADILRNKKSLTLKELSDEIISNLVKYLNANQGAIFILDGTESEPYLQMIACYAYNRKKYLDRKIEVGDGLAGQCFLEKQTIFLREIPEGYVKITSGLGEATPKSLFLSPLLVNESIYGVVELASLYEFESHHFDFVQKLSENIAATIKSTKESERTVNLLNASQQQAEELRAQEEEMRQNVEEMQATQEEMKRKSDELSSATAEMRGIISGIDATMATIEFTPDGQIVKANDNFLQTMGYTNQEIRGKHHRMFVPEQEANSIEYTRFWQRLGDGDSITGLFSRVNSKGDFVWLNAIYNPITDAKGNVVKVVKFATNVTQQQEMSAENAGVRNAIDSTMATIEFTPDGTVLNANDNFMTVMKYKLSEIKGKHHRMFVPKEISSTADYQSFWKKLGNGEAVSGVFKRVSSDGNVIWLNAIYSPITNASKQVVKVVKYASDITRQQELVAQSEGVMSGIDATMATIEFTPKGVILKANENFLQTVQYNLKDIQGKHHKMFVPDDVVNTEGYKTFWEQLASGKSVSGTFERVNSKRERVLLKAIYNPIRGASGEVTKVIKFATQVS